MKSELKKQLAALFEKDPAALIEALAKVANDSSHPEVCAILYSVADLVAAGPAKIGEGELALATVAIG